MGGRLFHIPVLPYYVTDTNVFRYLATRIPTDWFPGRCTKTQISVIDISYAVCWLYMGIFLCCSVERKVSQPIEGHAAAFIQFRMEGNQQVQRDNFYGLLLPVQYFE